MDNEVIRFLNNLPDAGEATRVSTYTVYIGSTEVLIDVHDRGPGTGGLRYYVDAYLAELKSTPVYERGNGHSTGNPAADLDTALHNVHWDAIRAETNA
ncbi:MAG: hypothetical protein ACTHMQ_04225 [Protaetiibacter sp.]